MISSDIHRFSIICELNNTNERVIWRITGFNNFRHLTHTKYTHSEMYLASGTVIKYKCIEDQPYNIMKIFKIN